MPPLKRLLCCKLRFNEFRLPGLRNDDVRDDGWAGRVEKVIDVPFPRCPGLLKEDDCLTCGAMR